MTDETYSSSDVNNPWTISMDFIANQRRISQHLPILHSSGRALWFKSAGSAVSCLLGRNPFWLSHL